MRGRTERTSTFSRMYRYWAAALRGVADARIRRATVRANSRVVGTALGW